MNYKCIGDHIHSVDIRNKDLAFANPLGVNSTSSNKGQFFSLSGSAVNGGFWDIGFWCSKGRMLLPK
jgi:hypothetical protein